MTRSSALLVVLLATPLACDKSQQTTPPPSEESTAASEPAPAPEPTDAASSEVAPESEDDLDSMSDEELAALEAEMDAEMADDESEVAMGETGLIGKGGGDGTGSGYGGGDNGFGGRGKEVPRVSQSSATVDGNLDRDIIRRIVRAHINEVRSCYNAGLTKNPDLSGKVSVAFTISATGKVSSSQAVDSADFADQTVVECIAKAVKKWTFPKPDGGGEVNVTYPFQLEPG